jgi:hypothetical protein
LAAAAEIRDLPLCSMADGVIRRLAPPIVDNAWKGKQKFRDSRTKQTIDNKRGGDL